MIYAAKTRATDNALTVGGIDGKLQNDILAFKSQADYAATLDELFARGDNLIRLTRKEVEGYMGRSFEVANDGVVCASNDAANARNDWLAEPELSAEQGMTASEYEAMYTAG